MSQQITFTAPTGFRASPLQARLWLNQGSVPSHAQLVLGLEGRADADALRAALHRVAERHEALRTTFLRPAGLAVPLQVILSEPTIDWRTEDLSALAPADQEARLAAALEDGPQIADLERGPILRSALLNLSGERHLLLIHAPALCVDARSLVLLAEELCAFYSGQRPTLDQPLQYADYAEWHHQLLESKEEGREAREHWPRLAAAPRSIPFGRRGQVPGGVPHAIRFSLADETVARIDALAARFGTTAKVVVLTCWQGLAARLTGERAAAIDYVLNGRTHADLDGAIGLFARRAPLSGPAEDAPFAEQVGEIRRALDEARRWQDYLGAQQAPVPSGVEFEWLPTFASRTVGGVRFFMEQLACHVAPDGLKLSCLWHEGQRLATLSCDAQLLDTGDLRRVARYLERILAGALGNPEAPLNAIDLVDEAERHRLLVTLNATVTDYSREQTIPDLFEEQAARTPDRPALIFGAERLTYADLNARANRLAHALRKRGVGRNDVVGLCLDRSADFIVALLGVLKAGGAYMPLYHDAPPARLAEQLRDAGCRIVVAQHSFTGRLLEFGGEVLCPDAEGTTLTGRPDANLSRDNEPGDLVYVLFTSGSTGRPKGVAVRHRNLVNYATFIMNEVGANKEALHFATVSTLAADLGNTCVFPALLSGGCLHVVGFETSVDGRLLGEYLACNPVDVLKITPSHLGALFGTGPAASLLPRKYLILGGEAVSWELVKRVTESSRCEVINHYGPTETTVGSLTFRLTEQTDATGDAATVPIGRPIANTVAYVVDDAGRPVPFGVPGELWIGGEGVTAGYLNQPESTGERFVRDPFLIDETARVYRTGDRVRYLADGTIEFLGRLDRQVKVRGFRVEPAEVEAVLCRHPSVRQAVVTTTTENGAATRLTAYCVPASDRPTPDELRRYLGGQLPEYMVPATITLLESLPLTANGKVDYRALPDPLSNGTAAAKPYVAPRDAVEEKLVAIWTEVLAIERVSLTDDFFDLGGHSLMATQVVSRIRGALGIQLPLRTIFESPTVAGLAEAIRQHKEEQKGEEVDQILAELEGLSDEEVQRLLALEMQTDAGAGL
jgi:amino acid adenylation domain-containing protein